MTTQTREDRDQVVYSDSDGQPMSDNTLQFLWITTLQGNLDALYRDDPEVFVAGDLLWYAVEGRPEVRTAPDAMVVFGRKKGYRGSYRQWEEGGIAPQVVFEVLSPGNRPDEMSRKFEFYDRHGVEEYYLYDPDAVELQGWRREKGRLQPIRPTHGWVSPRLRIRFDLSGQEMVVYRPDNTRFLTFVELEQERERAARRADEESRRADEERRRADEEQRRKEEERARAERLAAQLRALGVEPEA
jgi:Uma2 family endonuclease